MDKMLLALALFLSLEGIDAFVERALQKLHVPGAAVAVISNGETVLAKGYGVRSATSGKPVTADTTFAVGSVTKSFTSVVLATLVDEQKLVGTSRSANTCPGSGCMIPLRQS